MVSDGMQRVFNEVTADLKLRVRVILAGEMNGTLTLNAVDTKRLANMVSDWRDPDDITDLLRTVGEPNDPITSAHEQECIQKRLDAGAKLMRDEDGNPMEIPSSSHGKK